MAEAELDGLRQSLTVAVKASLMLPAPNRLAFVASWLLAEVQDQPLPTSGSEKLAGGTPATEMAAMAEVLTAAINAARGQPGWPTLAVAQQIQKSCADQLVVDAPAPALYDQEQPILDSFYPEPNVPAGQAEADETPVAQARLIFAVVDQDSSGFVDHLELKAHVTAHLVAQGVLPTPEIADAMATQLFATLDIDKDGRVTVSEWLRAYAASELQKKQGKGDQPLERAGGGGGIAPTGSTDQSLPTGSMITPADRTMPPARVRAIFAEWDTNQDGALSLDELQVGFAGLFTGGLAPHAEAAVSRLFEAHANDGHLPVHLFNRFFAEILFRHFDTNGDGALQRAEAEGALKFLLKPPAEGAPAVAFAYPPEAFDGSGELQLPKAWFLAQYQAME